MQNGKRNQITLTKHVVFHLKKKAQLYQASTSMHFHKTQGHRKVLFNLLNDTQPLTLSFFDIST